jgi:hypothetical protein
MSTSKHSHLHAFLYPRQRSTELDHPRELRRPPAIIKEFGGRDFMPAIDELVKEAGKTREQKP